MPVFLNPNFIEPRPHPIRLPQILRSGLSVAADALQNGDPVATVE